MNLLSFVGESVLLVLALTTDAFAAALAYGADKIRISRLSVLVISVVCTGMLAASMVIGRLAAGVIPQWITNDLGFWLLLCLGLLRLFDSTIKAYIRHHSKLAVSFSALDLRFTLTVYANAQAADADHSHTLCAREAAVLATALSLDGLAVGFGAAISGGSIPFTVAISLLLTACAVRLGWCIGNRIQKLVKLDLSIASAVLLLLLAALRLPF